MDEAWQRKGQHKYKQVCQEGIYGFNVTLQWLNINVPWIPYIAYEVYIEYLTYIDIQDYICILKDKIYIRNNMHIKDDISIKNDI